MVEITMVGDLVLNLPTKGMEIVTMTTTLLGVILMVGIVVRIPNTSIVLNVLARRVDVLNPATKVMEIVMMETTMLDAITMVVIVVGIPNTSTVPFANVFVKLK